MQFEILPLRCRLFREVPREQLGKRLEQMGRLVDVVLVEKRKFICTPVFEESRASVPYGALVRNSLDFSSKAEMGKFWKHAS